MPATLERPVAETNEEPDKFYKWYDPHPGGSQLTVIRYSKLIAELGKEKADDLLACSFATELSEREYIMLSIVAYL